MGPATRFVADAAAHLRELAGAVGANLQELVGAAATRAAVADAIRAAAARLRDAAEGLFVLAYAGHGARLPDRSGDDGDGWDEAWALDDRPLKDDDLTPLLGELHADVHVVLISNCCFAAGIVDQIGDGVTTRLKAGLPPMGRLALGSSDCLPAVDVAALMAAPAPMPTNRIVIAACGDEQMIILPSSSRLTLRVLDTVFPREGAVRRRQATDYAAVDAMVRGLASAAQAPMVLATEPDLRRTAFVAQRLRPG